MVRKEELGGVQVVFEVRAVGDLGWTWSYYPEQGAVAHNVGRLLATQDEALQRARAAAVQALAAGGAPG